VRRVQGGAGCTRLQPWRRLCAALLIACALPSSAHAQSSTKSESKGSKASSGKGPTAARSVKASKGASAADEPLTVMDEKASATFQEGLAAFDRRDFEAARVAFLQTFALKPSVPVVRRNLGLAEIYSGHYLDGARRLARVLHTTDEGSAEDRARMLDSLKKAEAHLERVSIEVRQESAEITIDGVDLGASPLPFLWYVAPGEYRVRVQKAGFVAHEELRVAHAGAAKHLVVALTPVPQEPAPPPRPVVAPSPEPAEPAGPNGWLLLTGGVVTAAAVAAGVAFTIAADANADKVNRLGETLPPFPFVCNVPNNECGPLLSATKTHDRQQRYAFASFAVAGATGVATLLYGLLGGGADDPDEAPVGSLQNGLSAGWAGSGPSLFWNGDF